ncbi:MAG: DUF308 domain-containing protein [Prevotella sp.]|nr:DUF308 domain-containing protein [Prevotella sp.]
MKVLQSSVFRAICAIVVGILLIRNPDSTVTGITIAIGAMFFISGAISCATYFAAKSRKEENIEEYNAQGQLITPIKPVFPIVGLGSVLLGLILMLLPDVFVKWLMYVLGAILLLGAINQFMALISANKVSRIPLWFWICPIIILLTGLFVILKPMETAGLPLIIIGWCLLLYGVSECINAIKINNVRKRVMKEMAARHAAENAEEAVEEEVKENETE